MQVVESEENLRRSERRDIRGKSAASTEMRLEVTTRAHLENEQQLVVRLKRAVQVDDERVRHALQDLTLDASLLHHLTIGKRVVRRLLENGFHRILFSRVRTRNGKHLSEPALAEHVVHLKASGTAVHQQEVYKLGASTRRAMRLRAVEPRQGDRCLPHEDSTVRLDQRVRVALEQKLREFQMTFEAGPTQRCHPGAVPRIDSRPCLHEPSRCVDHAIARGIMERRAVVAPLSHVNIAPSA
mmetsp:Transcript_3349/g.8029  ORF Transcript_3349/g.8029 Transcript_3349/m.8029 type:complete len:241 (+) Transcript_3349:1205-1927(+)